MSIAYRRIRNELRAYFMDKNADNGVKIIANDENMMNLKGIIKGVPGTPYQGGTYELEIKIGESYPYKAPEIKFLTKIWHPSVNPFTGAICLNDSDNNVWPVSMTIYKILIVIQSWMTNFHDKVPIDVEILQQAKEKTVIFTKTANFWAIKYAGARRPSDREFDRKVQLLTRVTRNENLAIVALSYHMWVLPNDVHDELAR